MLRRSRYCHNVFSTWAAALTTFSEDLSKEYDVVESHLTPFKKNHVPKLQNSLNHDALKQVRGLDTAHGVSAAWPQRCQQPDPEAAAEPEPAGNHFCAAARGRCAQHRAGAATCLSPRPLVMFTSFSMPPVSASALAFSMFLLVTSCKAQQIAATVSSDSTLGPLPPGSRLTRSRMAYLPRKTHRQNQVKRYILVLRI